MSQILHADNEDQSANSSPALAATHAIQIGLRLRPVDNSDRAVVANISAVQASAGMIFLDFGFLEQQAMNEINRLIASAEHKDATIEGRLECRIAMSLDNIVQLHRQLEQVVAANKNFRTSPADPGNSADATLQ
jgi:hypothetical protein